MTIWYNNQHRRGPWTTIVAAVCEGVPPKYQPSVWSVRDESVLEGLTKLWVEGETTYYGYL